MKTSYKRSFILLLALLAGISVWGQNIVFSGKIFYLTNLGVSAFGDVVLRLTSLERDQTEEKTFSDSNGNFVFYDITEGKYELRVHFVQEKSYLYQYFIENDEVKAEYQYTIELFCEQVKKLNILISNTSDFKSVYSREQIERIIKYSDLINLH